LLQHIFYSGWGPLLRTAVSTSASFIILIVLLRLAGPRVLAKWYAFDLVITVAIGSSFANNVLSTNTSVAQAGVGFIFLIGLQFIVSWIILHWSPMRMLVNASPCMVLHKGRFQDESMRRNRVAEADIRAAVRHHGFSSLEHIGAVFLEADGTFSVIEKLTGSCSALADVPELGGSNDANEAK
jgi:uncharacterized membrane protein YcaP (DUF421 family)